LSWKSSKIPLSWISRSDRIGLTLNRRNNKIILSWINRSGSNGPAAKLKAEVEAVCSGLKGVVVIVGQL
jgi:hypothetical protein